MWKLSETKSSCRARVLLFCQNWLCRGLKQWSCWVRRTGWTLHLRNTASRVWRRLFESLGSLVKRHGTSMRKIFQIDFKIFQRRVLFPLTGWYTRETCHDAGMMEVSFVYHASRVEKRNLPLAVRLLRNCTETFSSQFLGLGSDLYNYRQCFLCIYCQPLLFPPKVDCNSSLSCSAKILKWKKI